MLRDTHIAAGASAALLLVRPQGLLPAAGIALAALCGSVISDIDAYRSWSRKQADVLLGVSAAGFAGAGLIAAVTGQASYVADAIGAAAGIGKLASCALAVILCAFGMKKEHRGFMHSFAAGAALTACVYTALNRQQASAFLAGFLSHLALDLANHKGLQLFWPSKKRVSLHLCKSDGIVNRVLGAVFLVTAVLLFDACAGLGMCGYIAGLAARTQG